MTKSHEPPLELSDQLSRQIIFRDQYHCYCCQAPASNTQLYAYRIRPRSEAGSDDPDNLITLCSHCRKKTHHCRSLRDMLAIEDGSSCRPSWHRKVYAGAKLRS
jgi:hypothetical protein